MKVELEESFIWESFQTLEHGYVENLKWLFNGIALRRVQVWNRTFSNFVEA